MIFDAGLAGRLSHFVVDIDRLDAVADYVADTIRHNYPTLHVPFHARWRHFVVEGQDRWQGAVDKGLVPADRHARARARFELAITSVLLDAGAGPAWRWAEPIADSLGIARWLHVGRSEGLALASFETWLRGYFSSDLADPRRADAEGLATFSAEDLAKAFMVGPDNPLEGLEGRAALLQRLGHAIASRPDLFGPEGRLGGLYDTLLARAALPPSSQGLSQKVTCPPPPRGEGLGVGGKAGRDVRCVEDPPTPDPSPQGGGEFRDGLFQGEGGPWGRCL